MSIEVQENLKSCLIANKISHTIKIAMLINTGHLLY